MNRLGSYTQKRKGFQLNITVTAPTLLLLHAQTIAAVIATMGGKCRVGADNRFPWWHQWACEHYICVVDILNSNWGMSLAKVLQAAQSTIWERYHILPVGVSVTPMSPKETNYSQNQLLLRLLFPHKGRRPRRRVWPYGPFTVTQGGEGTWAMMGNAMITDLPRLF